jgi:coproporphyrinogen III oxidase-like Fe-S oxidoreductase
MPNHYGPAYEKKRKKERELEREVLLHLRAVNDPVNWEALQLHFKTHQGAEIGAVLHALKDGRYVAVDGKNNVSITDLGLKRLAAGMF